MLLLACKKTPKILMIVLSSLFPFVYVMIACKYDLRIWLTVPTNQNCLQSKYDNENNVVLAELGLDNNSFYKHQIPNSLECKCGLLTVSNFLLLYYSQIISNN